MVRGILLLSVVLASLVAWDRSLAERQRAEVAGSGRIARLVPEERRASLVVAGIGVETSLGEHFVYARTRGVWRLVEPPVGTFADAQALGGLVQSIVDAEGVVLTEDKLRAKSYGFGTDVALRVTLHGTKMQSDEDGDVLLCVDLGYPIQGTDGCYARPLGPNAVWAIDKNPRTYLTRPPGSSFPPMLDPFLIPGPVAAGMGGIARIELVRASGGFSLVPLAAPVDLPDGTQAEWELVAADGSRTPCHPVPSTGWILYMARATYERVYGQADVPAEVLDSPDARLVITPRSGEPFELLFGKPERGGGRPVINTQTRTAFGVSQEVAGLLLPSPETVADVERGNPWHAYIQVDPTQAALQGR